MKKALFLLVVLFAFVTIKAQQNTELKSVDTCSCIKKVIKKSTSTRIPAVKRQFLPLKPQQEKMYTLIQNFTNIYSIYISKQSKEQSMQQISQPGGSIDNQKKFLDPPTGSKVIESPDQVKNFLENFGLLLLILILSAAAIVGIIFLFKKRNEPKSTTISPTVPQTTPVATSTMTDYSALVNALKSTGGVYEDKKNNISITIPTPSAEKPAQDPKKEEPIKQSNNAGAGVVADQPTTNIA